MRLRTSMSGVVLGIALAASGAPADDEPSARPTQPNLVRQANAPISSILQIRVQDTYLPQFTGVDGQGNTVSIAVTMPLPAYRLLPLPQLSLLSIPTAVTLPGGSTGFGDLRFLDIVMLNAGHRILWGVGPTFVFPSASEPSAGQGKWQAGPAAVIAFTPGDWLVGILAQNPISFAGDGDRKDANALFLQPFATYQLGRGWFLRAQPQMVFDWQTGQQVLPLDLGAGRVFRIGRQNVSCFVEPFWNVSTDGPGPRYGVTFGVSLLYPDVWRKP
jgi:hypothetical protein